MEGILPPGFPVSFFEATGEEMGGMFRAFKDPTQGHEMVIKNNMFVGNILPSMVDCKVGDEVMNYYRTSYLSTASRKSLLSWPQGVSIGGSPESNVKVLNDIGEFMSKIKMPVLLIYADQPGVIIPRSAVPWCVSKIRSLETAFVGQGLHFLQEDQPDAIGLAIADWLRRHS